MNELFDLYQDIILDHNKRPRNFRGMDEATHAAEGHNPLCGDEIQVFVKVAGDKLEDVSFQGEGCAISRASASLMTGEVKGKTMEEAQREFERVQTMLTSDCEEPVDLLEFGNMASLSGVRRFPARIKCATLAWHALVAALKGGGEASTE
jgi:nitrogen fixation NifU-like protein